MSNQKAKTKDLLEKWEDLCAWIAEELLPVGMEGAVLEPLGQLPIAPELLNHSFASDNYNDREVAACLAGYLKDPDGHLLCDLFNNERERDRSLPTDALERLGCQSVVEDIVFSAARWCRQPHLRDSGIKVLQDIVIKTIDGEYWNTASYALTTLCHHQTPETDELLDKFARFCLPEGSNSANPPQHPSAPTLEQEAQFAKCLISGDKRTINAIEQLLDEKEEACKNVSMTIENKRWLQQFFDAAGASVKA